MNQRLSITTPKGKALVMISLLLIMAIIFVSRAFILGCVTAIIILAFTGSTRRSSRQLSVCFFSLALIGFFLLYFVKSDSTAGRLLVYKISYQIFTDHWLHGIGWNKFHLVYLRYQLAYFQSGHYSQNELLLADNTKHAFNDYWQFVLENGVFGLGVLIVVGPAIFLQLRKTFRRSQKLIPLFSATVLVSVLVAACFTHVFNHLPFQLIALTALYGISDQKFNKYFVWEWILMILILTCGICHYRQRLVQGKAYVRFAEARIWYKSGYLRRAYEQYRELVPDLKNEDSFWRSFASLQASLGNYSQASACLSKVFEIDYTSYDLVRLGNYSQAAGDLENAEKAYLQAVWMVPNRFRSRYDLFLFYGERQMCDRQVKVGQAILRLPVKIPSQDICRIKADVQKKLGLKCQTF